MEQIEMERNARQLYRVLAYTPKEPREEPAGYVDNSRNSRKTTHWDYVFAASTLKSVSLLVGFCKKNDLQWSVCERGIKVRNATNKQINKARKLCNKPSHRNPITLNF